MFLPKILLAFLCATSQGPDERFRVVAGETGIPETTLAPVRDLVRDGLQRLTPLFPGVPRGAFVVVVHRSGENLPAHVAPFHHRGSPGLALLHRGEIHLMLREIAQVGGGGMRGVVDHELVHILLHRFAGPCGDGLPRWLHEGLAQSLAGDTYLGASEQDLLWRVRTDTMMRWSELRDGFPQEADRLREAYAQSYSFVDFLTRRLGLEAVLAAAGHCPDGLEFERSLVRRTGLSMVTLDDDWRDYLVRDSGAAFRILLDNCFSFLVILAAPLLALAVIRRLRSDRRAADRMARVETEEDDSPPAAGGSS